MADSIKEFYEDRIIREVSRTVCLPVLSTKYTATDPTAIYKWTDIQLLDDDREIQNKKKRFSILEVIWIGVVNELKAFGFESGQIRKIKQQILVSDPNLPVKYPFFQFYLITAILFQKPNAVMVDREGNANIVNLAEDALFLLSEEVGNVALIKLNPLFHQLLGRINQFKQPFSELFKISQGELQLLAFIKQHDFESIKVVRKNGELYRFEGGEKVDKEKKIVDILQEEDYQSIEIERDGGKTSCIHRVIKKKV